MMGPVDNLPTDQGFPILSKLFVYSDVTDRNDGAVKVDEYYDIGIFNFIKRTLSALRWMNRALISI